ncbi:thioesterase II family protein [Streptococcus agalactiae]|uniref:Thioesterase n=1 Tax=Streptococcus agalactiae TaxID=1311 RepID=A0A0H1YDV4_STRAG|nr:thioesterase domain-containing protein [Streptococcus agalactiae]EPT35020.1 hypothetical protein SAG0021_00745 [Streptococcus agalactiae FSL S3-277]EPT39742.1 hypothetical protein SAG0029_03590 [Streptococcus agalactiae FSL S3-501]EPT40927.1 hypothetical protein SAG0030_06220 [Streptococcus agalactiae FSL S3-603]EPU42041.1 hypothetical protein SAG0181_03005 [Streptococcus agalactiae LDS 628]EPV86220.1 hypothetical protein SAG0007_09855 [Streptococcus agalactiae FSL C1-487]
MGTYIVNYDKKINNTNLKARLFLFPYAGGGSAAFRNWADKFEDIQLSTILYPGRECRFSDTPVDNIDVLSKEIFSEIINTVDFELPYFLFGHSMGTKVVYEVALKIKESEYPNPVGIIISGGRAPCYKEPRPIYHLDDNRFRESLKRYDGTPKEIIENEELFNIFLPMLRADFIVDEKYEKEKVEKLDTEILGLMGNVDEEISVDELIKWEDYTTAGFGCETISGAHMFVITNPDEVIIKIKQFIDKKTNEKQEI